MDEDDIRPISWRRLEFAGVTAILVTLGCFFIGQAAEQYAVQMTPPVAVVAKAAPKFNAIDYATTGSVKGGVVVIGPCDDRGR